MSGSCFPSPGNFYPRPPRGGRPQTAGAAVPFEAISIHALREEGDLISLSIVMAAEIFLSTPSARRATQGFAVFFEGHLFLSTPSARRATIPPTTTAPDTTISIHALREEGDTDLQKAGGCSKNFYPRPPRGGRPVGFVPRRPAIGISIHALREEGD